MKLIIEGTEKEIADFVLAVQNRQENKINVSDLEKQIENTNRDITIKHE